MNIEIQFHTWVFFKSNCQSFLAVLWDKANVSQKWESFCLPLRRFVTSTRLTKSLNPTRNYFNRVIAFLTVRASATKSSTATLLLGWSLCSVDIVKQVCRGSNEGKIKTFSMWHAAIFTEDEQTIIDLISPILIFCLKFRQTLFEGKTVNYRCSSLWLVQIMPQSS